MQTLTIRNETHDDAGAIRAVVTAAFKDIEHSSQTEAAIVDALREAGAMTVSLVAFDATELVGHVAFSPVTVDGREVGWYGLGPVAVRPDRQGAGIGSALIRAGLARLEASGAQGCVLVGEPEYYGRFGFKVHPDLIYPDLPARYFQVLPFGSVVPNGTVAYHAAFAAT